MTHLLKCPTCFGVVPQTASICPHCVADLPKHGSLAKLALGLLGGLGASMTLMACYGAPPCYQTLPDGGVDRNRYCYEPLPDQDGGADSSDGGVARDGGGSSDGDVTIDGGSDGGP